MTNGTGGISFLEFLISVVLDLLHSMLVSQQAVT